MAPQNRTGAGRFPKGVSGNPGGRPKGLRTLIESKYPHVRDQIADLYYVVAFGSQKQVARRFGAGFQRGLDERLEAATWLADRLDGRPTQAHEVSGPGGGAIQMDLIAEARDAVARKLERLAQRAQSAGGAPA